jgi:protein-histidine pros-kinase
MKLATKYNLVLISTLSVCFLTVSAITYFVLHKHAKDEVISQAAILMEAGLAMRKYTITEIKPLLALQNKRNFLPQSVPSYAATQNFNALREKHPEYRYKEATLNPTNPRDRAADWEADIISEFKNNPKTKHMTVVRDTPVGKTLYYAQPIRIKNKGCLSCHGVIEDAPETMLRLYGPANGFGWRMGEVVGSQIVSVPLSLPVDRANSTVMLLVSIIFVCFLLLYLFLHFTVRRLFVNRISQVASTIEEVNQGKAYTPTFNMKGNDEISNLCESVEHLCKQHQKTNKMLEECVDFDHTVTDRISKNGDEEP